MPPPAAPDLHLLLVDIQNDFVDPRGSMFAPGADVETAAAVTWLNRHRKRVAAVSLTGDRHLPGHFGEADSWARPEGQLPAPWSEIAATDVLAGTWRPCDPARREDAVRYARGLLARGQAGFGVYPVHCRGESWGQAFPDALEAAVAAWEAVSVTCRRVFLKGTNVATEQLSAVAAAVPDPQDPSTGVNAGFLDALEEGGHTLVAAGQKLSHCLGLTLLDAINARPDLGARVVLLADACGPAPGHEAAARAMVACFQVAGVRVADTRSFPAPTA